MIPKKIHFCWFGKGEKPKLVKKCINSWHIFCPDYEIIEWDENSFDICQNEYTKKCYEQKKYAFLTDYLRLSIILEHGGIYFDTDVEAIRNFDPLLENKAFFGFENDNYINTGEGFGAESGSLIVQKMLDEYTPLLDGLHGVIGCPILNTKAISALGFRIDGTFQCKNGVVLLPSDYLNPYDDSTGLLRKTSNSYSIHWYGKSWMSKRKVIRSHISKPFHRIQNYLKTIKHK